MTKRRKQEDKTKSEPLAALPALPALPADLWSDIAILVADTLQNAGTARLLNRGFSEALCRTQLRHAMKVIDDGRKARRDQLEQQDITNGINEEERANRMLVRAVEHIGDSRLHVFFTVLLGFVDKRWQCELRRLGLRAMRKTEAMFQPLNVQ